MINNNYMGKTEFFKKYGGALVAITNDDTEYGDFLILHPEETEMAKVYESKGCTIVSVHEIENGDDAIDMNQPCDYGNQPFKIGYLVLDKPNFK